MGKTGKKKKQKLVLTFNEEDRKNYLTGFRKRKEERKSKAKNELTSKLKKKIREERNKKRKAAREKVDKIMEKIDQLRGSLETTCRIEKVDFEDYEVTAKTGFEVEDLAVKPDPIKTTVRVEEVSKPRKYSSSTNRLKRKPRAKR